MALRAALSLTAGMVRQHTKQMHRAVTSQSWKTMTHNYRSKQEKSIFIIKD